MMHKAHVALAVAVREEMFLGGRKTRLFARSWRPQGRPLGLVVIAHGFMAHCGLYAWAAGALVRAGFATYTFDLRGHGKSEGERFWVEEFRDYVADFGHFVALARSRAAGVPVFAFGHGAGGVVASLYALENPAGLAGLISESSAYPGPVRDLAITVIRGLDRIAPRAHVLRLKPEDFSRDLKFVAQMQNDPLISHNAGPMHTLAEMARADGRLREGVSSMTLPVLVMHGTADRAGRPEASEHFFDALGSVDKTLKFYDGAFHDLLNDVGKELVMADLVEWLGARAALRPGRWAEPEAASVGDQHQGRAQASSR